MLDPIGFWSYARHDDEHSDGQLSQLRVIVGKQIGLQFGGEVTLWQDIAAIPYGADWAMTIDQTIGQTSFFLPIITPRYLKSENCHEEFVAFRQKMTALGRNDLVFPIHYVGVEDIQAADTVFGDDLAFLRRHQWIDFRPLFYADPRSAEVRRWAGALATSVLKAMRRSVADPVTQGAAQAETIAAESNEGRQQAAVPTAVPPITPASSPIPAAPPEEATVASTKHESIAAPVPLEAAAVSFGQFGDPSAPSAPDEAVVRTPVQVEQARPSRRAIFVGAGVGLAGLAGIGIGIATKRGQLAHLPSRILTGHRDAVESIAFSSNGRTLASASDDETIKLWEMATGALRLTLQANSGPVHSIAFSPTGLVIASASSGGNDFTCKLWDAVSGALQRTLSGHDGGVQSVAFSPDGGTLASGSTDKTVKLWDAASGTLQRTLSGHDGWVQSVAFSIDGRTLASGSDDKTVKLWDVASGTLQQTLTGHSGGVNSVAFSPDGHMLASGSDDKTAKLWDAASGTPRSTLIADIGPLNSVAFSPDSRTLAAGGNTIALWDTASGALQSTLAMQNGFVHSVAFSPDQRTLAAGSWDGTIKLWFLSST